MKSEEAFKLASSGLLRPKSIKTPPQIYSLRCIEFDRPFFKIGKKNILTSIYLDKLFNFRRIQEVFVINESTKFLRNLIHDIGLRLRTYSVCHQIRRTQDGFIDYESPDCMVLNNLNFDTFLEKTQNLNKIAEEYIKNYDKTVLIGHNKAEEADKVFSE